MVARVVKKLSVAGCTALAAAVCWTGTALAEAGCPTPEECRLTIPVSGNPDHFYDVDEYEPVGRSELAEQGVTDYADQNYVINYHLKRQREAQILAQQNPIAASIAKQFNDCMQDWIDENGLSTNLGAYVARVVSSEGKKIHMPACRCEIDVPVLGRITVSAADVNERVVVYCEKSKQVRVGGVPGHPLAFDNTQAEPCPGEDHTYVSFFSQRSANLSTNPSDYLHGTQVAPGYDACNFAVRTEGHRKKHSCFAKGTQIRMADGSEQKVEELKEGDLVWNPVLKRGVAVEQLVVGAEPIPLIELTYGERKLVVSQRHPFLLPQTDEVQLQRASVSTAPNQAGLRIRLARELEAGDQVLMEDGKLHRLSGVRQLPVEEDQVVYNFSLDLPGHSPDQHAVVSEGVVSGDYKLQLEVNRQLSH